MAEETNKILNNIENVAANEANLEAKIEKKKIELERNQVKSLFSTQSVQLYILLFF